MPRNRPRPNRSDLREPVTTSPGQEYGTAAAQRAAQGAVPLAAAPLTPAAPLGAPGQPATQAAANPEPLPAAGTLPFLHPTDRPGEPVTAGLSIGPGSGPEALPTTPGTSVADQLARIAQGPGASPAVQRMAALAAQMRI